MLDHVLRIQSDPRTAGFEDFDDRGLQSFLGFQDQQPFFFRVQESRATGRPRLPGIKPALVLLQGIFNGAGVDSSTHRLRDS